MKVSIVGGVAGGALCASRRRRLDEKIDVLNVERGPFVSYAKCGLTYHVGGSIEEESSLLVATEHMFKVIFTIDISAKEKTVQLKNHLTGEISDELRGYSPYGRWQMPGMSVNGLNGISTGPLPIHTPESIWFYNRRKQWS